MRWIRPVVYAVVIFAIASLIFKSRGPLKTATSESHSTLIGSPAPVFTAATSNGQRVDLSAMKGQVVVLDFWATWCPPCIESLPKTIEIAGKFAGQGVKLYAVNISDSADKTNAFLIKNNLAVDVPLLADQRDVLSRYNVQYIPLIVIVDRAGNISNVGDGIVSEEWLTAAIETAMKSGQAAKS